MNTTRENEMTLFFDAPIIRCSKCKSDKIVEPANEADFIYRCENCGHEKKPEPPTTLETQMANASSWEQPKEIEF